MWPRCTRGILSWCDAPAKYYVSRASTHNGGSGEAGRGAQAVLQPHCTGTVAYFVHLCLSFSLCLFCPDFNNHPNIWISSQRPCACVEARGCAVLLRAGPPWSGARTRLVTRNWTTRGTFPQTFHPCPSSPWPVSCPLSTVSSGGGSQGRATHIVSSGRHHHTSNQALQQPPVLLIIDN